MGVSSVIWRAAGSLPMGGSLSGVCGFCGESTASGTRIDALIKDTFTDFDKIVGGTVCCDACAWCLSERNDQVTALTKKDKPQKFRNYSHLVVDGQWYCLSKGQKAEIAALLLRSPTIALIATSGQKHLFFRSVVGWWQVEEQRIPPDPIGLQRLMSVLGWCYQLGISKAELESGHYRSMRGSTLPIADLREAEQRLQAHRGTLLFDLALYLTTASREDESEESRD